MKERNIHEWFDLIARANNDQEFMRMFFMNLDGYKGQPSTEDLIQFVNFLSAVRLHQLRDTFRGRGNKTSQPDRH